MTKSTLTVPGAFLDDMIRAKADFYLALGAAIAEWSNVERGLYYWFRRLTRMDDKLGRALFYGPRGFAARAEIIESVVALAPNQQATEVAFVKAIDKKARQYSPFRNTLAHGQIMSIFVGNPPRSIHMAMGDAENPNDMGSVTLDQVGIAANNFAALAQCIIVPSNPHGMREDESIEGFLAQVLALPTLATDKNGPTPSEPERQPQAPVHRNKKAHRAERAAKKRPARD